MVVLRTRQQRQFCYFRVLGTPKSTPTTTAADVKDFLLGRLALGCGLYLRLLLGLLLHHRLKRLLPQNTVIAVLQVDDVGAASLKAGRPSTIATLGQDQLETALILGGAERAGDERNRSWSLRALERP